jgi:Mg2+ and Co2+ transporter CorA
MQTTDNDLLVDVAVYAHSKSFELDEFDYNFNEEAEDEPVTIAHGFERHPSIVSRHSTETIDSVTYHERRESLSEDERIIPEPGRNIEDIFHKITIEGTCFSIIGLGYECHSFNDVEKMWRHMTSIFHQRANDTHKPTQEPIWIDIQTPSVDDIKYLERKLGLHHLTVEDILEDLYSIETAEQYPYYVRLFLRGLPIYGEHDETVRVNIFVFAQYVLTIRDAPVQGLEEVLHKLSRYETIIQDQKRKRTIVPSPDWILHSFVDALLGSFMPLVDGMMQESENIDELVVELLPKERYDLIMRIGAAKKLIGQVARSLMIKRDVIARVRAFRTSTIGSSAMAHLHDASDRLTSTIDRLEAALEGVHNAHAHCLSKMQIDRKQSREGIKKKANQAAILLATLSPFALVAGIWGMNTGGVPGWWAYGPAYNNLTWFLGICAFMILVTLTLAIVMRPKLLEFEYDSHTRILAYEPLVIPKRNKVTVV